MNKRINAAVTGAVVGLASAANAAAQTRLQDKFFGGGDEGVTDVASAGNGGVATASANGGAVSIGDVNSVATSVTPSALATRSARIRPFMVAIA